MCSVCVCVCVDLAKGASGGGFPRSENVVAIITRYTVHQDIPFRVVRWCREVIEIHAGNVTSPGGLRYCTRESCGQGRSVVCGGVGVETTIDFVAP